MGIQSFTENLDEEEDEKIIFDIKLLYSFKMKQVKK